jgi:hypothetical protein
MAIESPPNVIVFRLKPILSSAIMAASRDSGIAVQEMAAVRRLKRNKNRTTTTRTAPMSNEFRTLWRDLLRGHGILPSGSLGGWSHQPRLASYRKQISTINL